MSLSYEDKDNLTHAVAYATWAAFTFAGYRIGDRSRHRFIGAALGFAIGYPIAAVFSEYGFRKHVLGG